MRTIELTNTFAVVAYVDDEDYERVNKYRWRLQNYGYIISEGIGMLHRLILEIDDDRIIDHINQVKHDCRKENLRVVSRSVNAQNSKHRINNASGFKGVSWHSQKNKWRANLSIGGRKRHLGLFESAVDAAIAYNNAAIKHYGEHAALNPIPTNHNDFLV